MDGGVDNHHGSRHVEDHDTYPVWLLVLKQMENEPRKEARNEARKEARHKRGKSLEEWMPDILLDSCLVLAWVVLILDTYRFMKALMLLVIEVFS